MPCRKYEEWSPGVAAREIVDQANRIIAEYRAEGYDLTLRQLYYQFVSRDLLPNTQREYKRLGDIVSKGRRAGLIDWSAITDRTRNLRALPTWDAPAEIVRAAAEQFKHDRWATQPCYVEVWFEKDALMGVFERSANDWRVPFFSCRGYTSDSEVWAAAQRMAAKRGQQVHVLHFGDHDPSGLDMTRDIEERLALFGASVTVTRLALNMDQVEQYQPPPNPAKETDSRFLGYQSQFGDESWELDALEPSVLADLVRREVGKLVDRQAWAKEVRRERKARAELGLISGAYRRIISGLDHALVEKATRALAADEPELPDEDEQE